MDEALDEHESYLQHIAHLIKCEKINMCIEITSEMTIRPDSLDDIEKIYFSILDKTKIRDLLNQSISNMVPKSLTTMGPVDDYKIESVLFTPRIRDGATLIKLHHYYYAFTVNHSR